MWKKKSGPKNYFFPTLFYQEEKWFSNQVVKSVCHVFASHCRQKSKPWNKLFQAHFCLWKAQQCVQFLPSTLPCWWLPEVMLVMSLVLFYVLAWMAGVFAHQAVGSWWDDVFLSQFGTLTLPAFDLNVVKHIRDQNQLLSLEHVVCSHFWIWFLNMDWASVTTSSVTEQTTWLLSIFSSVFSAVCPNYIELYWKHFAWVLVSPSAGKINLIDACCSLAAGW